MENTIRMIDAIKALLVEGNAVDALAQLRLVIKDVEVVAVEQSPMVKVVLNGCYGGFGLSEEAQAFMEVGPDSEFQFDWQIPRDHPRLIECIETLGSERASSESSYLYIEEVSSCLDWYIDEYDGNESLVTK